VSSKQLRAMASCAEHVPVVSVRGLSSQLLCAMSMSAPIERESFEACGWAT
jgi:hypothetical protein